MLKHPIIDGNLIMVTLILFAENRLDEVNKFLIIIFYEFNLNLYAN